MALTASGWPCRPEVESGRFTGSVIGPMVEDDKVPALADAEALCALTEGRDVTRWGLVLNERGAQRALEAGIDHLQFVASVSATHSLHNANRSPDEAVDALAAVCTFLPAHALVEVTLATAFGCPYEHRVPPDDVVTMALSCLRAGATSIGLADTIGSGLPVEVASLCQLVRSQTDVPLGVHLHDTHGLAVANALAAFDAGVFRFDGTVGALGGCPFAPGASGNVALEDLTHLFNEMGLATGVSVTGLIDAADLACGAVNRPVGSHVGVAGPRFNNHHATPPEVGHAHHEPPASSEAGSPGSPAR